MKENKNSQITIFVIIGILIIGAVVFVFTLSNKTPNQISVSPIKDPQGYIRECATNAVVEAEGKISPQGGFLNLDNSTSIMFNSTKVKWLCYTPMLKMLCTNRHPMLNKEIEKEIESIAKPQIEECFNIIQEELKNYEYKQEELLNFSVFITPNQIAIKIYRKISFIKNQQTINIDNFNIAINSPLYNFVSITNEAINQEVSCNCGEETCNADIFKINKNNPGFEISRFITGRNEKIYTIKEQLSEKKFNFAVRNCVRLP